jgi:ABC-2 type transport system permease protein
MFSATSVVIAAALGGLMVPSFLMPRLMRALGRFLPLNWGLDAFLDVFVRNGSIADVLPNVLLLLAFFVVTTMLSVLASMQRE